MPTWIENVLQISGERTLIDDLLASIKAEDGRAAISFQRVTPAPEHYDEDGDGSYLTSVEFSEAVAGAEGLDGADLREYLAINPGIAYCRSMELVRPVRVEEGWIVWRLQKWGASTDVDDHSDSERYDDGTVEIFMSTFVGPPEPMVTTLAGRYPALEFDMFTVTESLGSPQRRSWRNGHLSVRQDTSAAALRAALHGSRFAELFEPPA